MSLSTQFESGGILQRNRYIRMAWTESENHLFLFIAGEKLTLSASYQSMMNMLTGVLPISLQQWESLRQYEGAEQVLNALIQHGGWYWE